MGLKTQKARKNFQPLISNQTQAWAEVMGGEQGAEQPFREHKKKSSWLGD